MDTLCVCEMARFTIKSTRGTINFIASVFIIIVKLYIIYVITKRCSFPCKPSPHKKLEKVKEPHLLFFIIVIL